MRITKHCQHLREVGWVLGSCPLHSKEAKPREPACDRLVIVEEGARRVKTPRPLLAALGWLCRPSSTSIGELVQHWPLIRWQSSSKVSTNYRLWGILPIKFGEVVYTTQFAVAWVIIANAWTPQASVWMCHWVSLLDSLDVELKGECGGSFARC